MKPHGLGLSMEESILILVVNIILNWNFTGIFIVRQKFTFFLQIYIYIYFPVSEGKCIKFKLPVVLVVWVNEHY